MLMAKLADYHPMECGRAKTPKALVDRTATVV
jgi:hypothetical protein